MSLWRVSCVNILSHRPLWTTQPEDRRRRRTETFDSLELVPEVQVVQEDPCWELTWMSLVKVSIQASTVFLIRTWSVQSLQRTQKKWSLCVGDRRQVSSHFFCFYMTTNQMT